MDVMLVDIQVKPGMEEAFIAASLENARASVKEAGIARFDVIRSADDPSRFTLIEAYRIPEGPALHRETSHYALWKKTVEPMMSRARGKTMHSGIFVPELA